MRVLRNGEAVVEVDVFQVGEVMLVHVVTSTRVETEVELM